MFILVSIGRGRVREFVQYVHKSKLNFEFFVIDFIMIRI